MGLQTLLQEAAGQNQFTVSLLESIWASPWKVKSQLMTPGTMSCGDGSPPSWDGLSRHLPILENSKST